MRFSLLIGTAALLVPCPALAQDNDASAVKGREIVVQGQPLSDLKRILAACLARKCPPDQDIAATLAVAESQFVGGNYDAARTTLTRSIDRNKRFAKTYPIPVSDLLRANYRVAEHLGDGEAFRVGTFDMVSALRAGLPASDPRILAGEVEVGDMYVRFDRVDEAIAKYAAIEKKAGSLGLWYLQGMARLRMVSLFSQLAEKRPFPYREEARRMARTLTTSADTRMAPFAQAARVMLARIDARDGDAAAIDRLIADVRATSPKAAPVLIYQPSIEAIDRKDLDAASGTTTMKLARINYDGAWVDIGFWIAPDGHVRDASVLRSGKEEQPAWTKPILIAISGRRYAPLEMDAALPGVMRVERYTLTARVTYVTGSRMWSREQQPQIEMLDLTADPVKTASLP